MKFYTPFKYSAKHKAIVHCELISGDTKKKRYKYTPLSGVCPVNKKLFYPGYKYANAVLVPPGTIGKQKNKGKRARASNCAGKKDGPQWGKRLGKLLMKQMKATVGLYLKYSCSQRVFYNMEARRKFARTITTTPEAKERFLKICNTMHSHTEKLWRWLDHKCLNPIGIDHGVGDLSTGRGSELDMVCMNPMTSKVTLFEMKDGYTDYLYHHTHQKMNYPFGDKNDCQLHQHFLQLMATCDLYQRTHPEHEIDQCLWLRLDRDCVEVEPLPDWVVARRAEMISMIEQRPRTTTQ